MTDKDEIELHIESEEIRAKPSRWNFHYTKIDEDTYELTATPKVIMLKKIQVTSRSVAPTLQFAEPWAAVQISSDYSKIPALNEANLAGTIKLEFGDVEFAGRGGGITTEQARQILEFVAANADHVETLLVHCDAGQSRSAAVAAALSVLWSLNEQPFHKPPYTPNMLVYRTILGEAAKMEYYKPVFDKILEGVGSRAK